jgi:hypothetical protein
MLLHPAGMVYVFLVATRDIKAGDELLLDYDIGGLTEPEWWTETYLTPVSTSYSKCCFKHWQSNVLQPAPLR